MNFSFIHISDIHLGRPFSGLSKFSCDENKSKIYKTAVEKALNNAIDYAILKNVDCVFIAGDTFDSSECDFSSKLILKNALKRLENSDIEVYLIAGNHDPISSYNKNTFNFKEDSKVKIIGLNTPISAKLPLHNKNDELVGYVHALSFNEEKFEGNPLKYFDNVENNLLNIGLLHCDLNADNSSPYAPCSLAELKSFNYDYWALGHIHLPSKNDVIAYTGTLQGRNTKETGAHGVRYVKIENNNIIKNVFVPMDVVRYEDLDIDLSCANDETDALNLIEEKMNSIVENELNSCEVYLIRLKLSGCVSFYSQINDEFYNVLSDKIDFGFTRKIYLSQIENNLQPTVEMDLLKDDDGIAGELFHLINNSEILQATYDEVLCQMKNLKLDVDMNSIINTVKDEGTNLCSLIYNDYKEVENE